MIIMDSDNKINQFLNTNMIATRKKVEMSMNLLTNSGSEIVDEVGGIPGEEQKSIQR